MIIMVEREQIILPGGFGSELYTYLSLRRFSVGLHYIPSASTFFHIPAALAKAGGNYGVFI